VRTFSHRTILPAIALLFLCNLPAGELNNFAFADSSNAVQIQFASGDTELDTFSNGVKLFDNDDDLLQSCPPELINLQFTRRTFAAAADVTIDVPAGTTVYVIVGLGSAAKDSRDALTSGGWNKIGILGSHGSHPGNMGVYKLTFNTSQHVVIPSGQGSRGAIVAAAQLSLVEAPKNDSPPPDQTPPAAQPIQTVVQSNVTLQTADSGVPETPISKLQSTIKMLCVIEQPNGDPLGEAMDLILTVSPGSPKDDTIPVTFAIPVGNQMNQVLGDVARAINARYPRLSARKLEYSFEDRLNFDGPSVGAALGVLMLSTIKGFDIDPQFAVTGDLSAEGKVRVIGGVGAKLRGAHDAGCTIVAVPNEDLEELIDAVIFNGTTELTNTQVIGISTLDDAVAIARSDRDPNEQQAIDLFSEIQKSMQASTDYLHSDDALTKLTKVTQLAPNHLSARLLLQIAQNTARRHLTPMASIYYAQMELVSVIPVLTEKDVATGTQHLMPAAVNTAIRKLNYLRPRADIRVQPFVDSCIELIQARNDYDTGTISHDQLMLKLRAYTDEFDKLQDDRALMEKMLHEGV
jgi:hypothetical protein